MKERTFSKSSGLMLAIAAVLFWVAWVLMPGVGVTDSREIFRLVGSHRPQVMVSVIVQLLSAVLYVPAMLGMVTDPRLTSIRGVRLWAGVVVIGAMGSAADAVLHLLAFAMTAPTVDTAASIPVMEFMQGPGLWLLAPLIASFFVGGVALAVSLVRARLISSGILWLYVAGLAVGVLGGLLASQGIVSSRFVGLTVLGAVSLAQALVGLRIGLYGTRGLPTDQFIKTKGEQS